MISANSTITLSGYTAAGFESLRTLFERNMTQWAEEHAQLCIYHRGVRVVDLWASKGPVGNFNADSTTNVFSSGKNLEAIALAYLAGDGLLDYARPIAHYWPEFGQHGKNTVTVAELMRHEAGLANFDFPIAPEDLSTARIKQNVIGRLIESHPQHFHDPARTRREYHAVTRGWIANELFRRVDPAGRTIGEYVRDDISTPLGADVAIGVSTEQLKARLPIRPVPVKSHFFESCKPKLMGRRVLHNTVQLVRRLYRVFVGALLRPPRISPPPFEGMHGIAFFNESSVAMGETPSANTTASARGLAKIAAAMAAGGSIEQHTILNPNGWKLLHDQPVEASMNGFIKTCFTQGGVDSYQTSSPQSSYLERAFNQGREGFYGWMGLGGSLFQWHPGLDIGFAFVPTSLHMLDVLNERGKTYQAEVLRCINAAQHFNSERPYS